MSELEIIVALLTFGSVALTIVKVYRKHTKWYWNIFPYMMGFVSCLWLAKIFG